MNRECRREPASSARSGRVGAEMLIIAKRGWSRLNIASPHPARLDIPAIVPWHQCRYSACPRPWSLALTLSDGRFLLHLILIGVLVGSRDAAAQESVSAPNCKGAEHRQFDFWIGDWIVTDVKGDTVGTNRIQSISDGCALLEQWLSSGGVSGTSINFLEPGTGRWNQLWIGGRAMILRLEGGLEDRVMELTGTSKRKTASGTVLDRLRWTPASDGSVEQLWLVSSDDGATWRDLFRGTYRQRVQH